MGAGKAFAIVGEVKTIGTALAGSGGGTGRTGLGALNAHVQILLSESPRRAGQTTSKEVTSASLARTVAFGTGIGGDQKISVRTARGKGQKGEDENPNGHYTQIR